MVLLIAAAVILAGVVVVAIGRGGELAMFPADVRPFEAEIVTAADVVLLRPPPALFGYNRQVSDDVLSAIARTITERDVEIATLRRQLAELQTWNTTPSPRASAERAWDPAAGQAPSPRASAERAWDPAAGQAPSPRASAEPAWDPPAGGPAPPPRASADDYAADDYAAAGSAEPPRAPAADLRPPADSAGQDQDSQVDAP